jgi:[CysO sulfur-carrier protein]-S-L-cysteine hydrolase
MFSPEAVAGEQENRNVSGNSFSMTQSVWNEVCNHCMEQLPYEACGLLSGTNGKAKTVWKIENVLQSPVAFEMNMEQVRKALQLIKEKEEELVGIYHSHPTAPPDPSEQDIVHANDLELVYFIVSCAGKDPVMKGFHIRKKKAIPLSLEVIEDSYT